MNCNETYPLLHAYADGELDLVRSLDVERHLKTCPACAAARDSIQSLRSALRKSDPRANVSRQWFWQVFAFGATALAILIFLLRPAGISEADQLANEAISG